MQWTELFLSLAEIAGVFVGFGALIVVRSGASMSVGEVNSIRWVLTTGIWVVVVALAPIIISSYGPAGRELWLASSLVALVLLGAMIAVYSLAPENRADYVQTRAALPLAKIILWAIPMFWLPVAALVVALLLVVSGAFPDQEQPLYLTAVALGLYMGAMGLFAMVFIPSAPASPPGRAEPPGATGAHD